MKSRLDHWKEFDFLGHCSKLAGAPVSFEERNGWWIAWTTEAGAMAIGDAYVHDANAASGYSEEDGKFYFTLKQDI